MNVQKIACNTATSLQRCTMLRVAQTVAMQHMQHTPLGVLQCCTLRGSVALNLKFLAGRTGRSAELPTREILQGHSSTLQTIPLPSSAYARCLAEPRDFVQCIAMDRSTNRARRPARLPLAGVHRVDFCPDCGEPRSPRRHCPCFAVHTAQSNPSYPQMRRPLLARPENTVRTKHSFGQWEAA